MNIGNKIFELRKAKCISQEELAQQLGVSRQSVSKWESGNVMPDLDKAVAMCKIFGVSADYLLGDSRAEPEKKAPLNEEFIEDDLAENEENLLPDEEEIPEVKPPKKRGRVKRTVALVVAICLLVAVLIPLPLGGYKKLLAKFTEEPVTYKYVLVHGMGGWGSAAGINSVSPYWGSTTGSLSAYLNAQGYSVAEVTVGPFSSAWDRACEAYAQLTGTRVDYGAAHSKAHNHERYGRTYSEPLAPGWGTKTPGGQLFKVNLVGHSFGGNTVRMLTSLLEYGAAEEIKASPEDCSPLFAGGKGNWVNSVTTLCSPHNGSTLYYLADRLALVKGALQILYAAGLVTDTVKGGVIDFQLEHFGIDSNSDNAVDLVGEAFSSGTDNAFYDLSLEGAKEMNERIKTVESVCYFSYAYCTTEKSALTANQIPISSTLLVLRLPARFIGSYTDPERAVDETWLPNDGLVNVVSAQHPADETWVQYNPDETPARGKWYVMPVLAGDHGTVIGMTGDVEKTHTFYTDLFKLIDSQARVK